MTIVLGATGNVGGRIVRLLIKSPLCKKVVVVTRRKTDAFANPKVSEVIVDMDRLEEEVAPHTPRESTSRSPRSASARVARRCPRRRCARSKSPTRKRFAAPPRLEALVCAGS